MHKTKIETTGEGKIMIENIILSKQSRLPFKWKDIKHIKFEDDDQITIGYSEGNYSEDSSMDPHHFAMVVRMVEETDEQHQKRLVEEKFTKDFNKACRRERYLKLKKEFENE